MDRVANGDGSQMNTGTMTKFADLSEAWFAGAEPAKAGSRIEYRTATGRVIAPGITLCDDSIVVRGDGTVEFRRRGDLGEREDFPPGYWTSACDPSQVERLWEKLGDLGPDSFPARVADPGDTVAFLTGYVAGRIHTLTIGPSDPTRPAPGDAFMQELYPILRLQRSAACHWSVLCSLAGIVRTAEGAEAEIRFRNPGARAIGLVFDGQQGTSDFHLRFAQDREEIPYPEWHHCDNPPADADKIRLVSLEPGEEIVRKVRFPCSFPDSGKYIGKFSYRQPRYLDSLAGIPILTGVAYTEVAEFTV